jgi:hypothetical protein
MGDTVTTGHQPMEAVHIGDTAWETLRWPGQWSKMLFHPRPERATERVILTLANSFDADEPLRRSFLASEPIRRRPTEARPNSNEVTRLPVLVQPAGGPCN